MDSIFELFIWGVFGTFCLSILGMLIYLLFKLPLVFLGIVIGFFFIVFVGWCMKHFDDFWNLFVVPQEPPPSEPTYGIHVLDRLQYLENKYRINTVQFMSCVYRDVIPYGMDNLDYLEWLALVNELACFGRGD